MSSQRGCRQSGANQRLSLGDSGAEAESARRACAASLQDSMSAKNAITRSRWTGGAGGCTTPRLPTERPGRAGCSTSSPGTARFLWWSTTPPRSVPCRSPSPARAGTRWAGLRGHRENQRPRRLRDRGRPPPPYAESTRATRPWPNWKSWIGYDNDLAGETTRISGRIRAAHADPATWLTTCASWFDNVTRSPNRSRGCLRSRGASS